MWRVVCAGTLGVALLAAAGLIACAPSPDGDELARGSRLPDRASTNDADASSTATTTSSNNANPPADPSGNNPSDTDGGGGGATPSQDAGPTANPPPAPTPPCGQLGVSATIKHDETVVSCDKRFTLIVQTDGNLVLYKNGVGALWSSNTYGTAAERAIMQGDGNFVVYTGANQAVFNTGTQNHPGAILAVQDDGNLVVYEGANPLWASNTAGN